MSYRAINGTLLKNNILKSLFIVLTESSVKELYLKAKILANMIIHNNAINRKSLKLNYLKERRV